MSGWLWFVFLGFVVVGIFVIFWFVFMLMVLCDDVLMIWLI